MIKRSLSAKLKDKGQEILSRWRGCECREWAMNLRVGSNWSAFQRSVQFEAIDDRAGVLIKAHLGQCKWAADHVVDESSFPKQALCI